MPRATKTAKTEKTTNTTTDGDGPSAADRLHTALRRHPDSTARELAEFAGIGGSTATKLLASWAVTGTAVRLPGPADGGRKVAARWVPTELPHEARKSLQAAADGPRRNTTRKSAAAPAPTSSEVPSGRLAKGALHGLVEDFLTDHDDDDSGYTAGEIARKLERSAGAVRNALDKLTDKGYVVMVQDEPRRYRLANA